jgi:uncharacterized Tic20 family protein
MQPSNDERTLAGLAHASIVLNTTGLIGVLAAGVIWATQRERSAFVRAHALQALLYQVVVLVLSLVLVLSWAMCVSLSLLPAALRPELYEGSLPGPFWLALSGMILPVVFGILAVVYALVGAVQVFRGRPFRYPLIGRLVAADLQPEPAALPATPAPAPSAPPAPAALPATPAPTEAPPAAED